MTDMFKQGDKFLVSAEFREFVIEATEANVRPFIGEPTEVVEVKTLKSGQTLFIMKFDAMCGGMYDSEPDEGMKLPKKFPATVAQVQKMAKLKKKADKETGIVAPVKVSPNVKAAPVVDDGYDPFAASQDDF